MCGPDEFTGSSHVNDFRQNRRVHRIRVCLTIFLYVKTRKETLFSLLPSFERQPRGARHATRRNRTVLEI